MTTVTCSYCDGTGQVESLIEGELYPCGACGGHKVVPLPDTEPIWFYHKADRGYMSQRAAVVTAEPGGNFRVTFYTPTGPLCHSIEYPSTVFSQLKSYTMHPIGGRMVDTWSKSYAWAEGMKWIDYIEAK